MRVRGCVAAWLGLLLAGPGEAAWHEVTTPHFVIYSEGSTDRTRRFAVDLENFDEAAQTALDLDDRKGDNPNPLTVFVVDNVNAVKKLCEGGQAPDRAKAACRYIGGFYQGRVSGSVAFVPRNAGSGPLELDARTVFFHEYVHHLMLAHSHAAYPAWYVEGFAELISNVELRSNEIIIGYPARSRSMSLYGDDKMPVWELMAANPSALSPDRRSTFYARAWLLTHFLTFSEERKSQLTQYLQAINQGKSSDAAARGAFGDLQQLDREVQAYLIRNRFAYLPVAVTQPAPETIKLRQLTPGEAAMMPVRLQSQRMVDSRTAPLVAADARRIAAAWPNDPEVQLILAEAELDAGDAMAAEAAADRALAADPAMRGAMIFKAQALMKRAQDENRFDDVTWRTARSWLLKANKLEPDAAWPLMLFYSSFLQQGEKPTRNAVSALERSAELTPQDGQVRMMLVSQYLRDRQLKAARSWLVPLAFDPHASAGNPARRLLERLDRDGLAVVEGPGAGLIDEPVLELPPEDQ
ncbi:hypothetical protein ASD39_14030 [Sphingomonas sp. Root50]|nr:hypothetical protein ASD17_10835 [Sphingomonas sp. Root1294]KQY65259.1 hypothetical protein ASD39_14030 [Sphingomonas sp. Root50]KRB95447.1 hypothetical protein ASE22_06025 [Sphingomonas sp. Root720]